MPKATLKILAAETLVVIEDAPTNFAVFGRQHYGRSGKRVRSANGTIRPYYPPGQTHTDWSWKPPVDVRIALNAGNAKCAAHAFDQYLAGLTPAERTRVLANKRAYNIEYGQKLRELERVFDEQMEGWSENSPAAAKLGAVSLTSRRI